MFFPPQPTDDRLTKQFHQRVLAILAGAILSNRKVIRAMWTN
jgi:hypothetical protein